MLEWCRRQVWGGMTYLLGMKSLLIANDKVIVEIQCILQVRGIIHQTRPCHADTGLDANNK